MATATKVTTQSPLSCGSSTLKALLVVAVKVSFVPVTVGSPAVANGGNRCY